LPSQPQGIMASDFDLNTLSLSIPPEGVIPNFINPVSMAFITRDVIYAFVPVMVLFLALRIFSRVIIKHSFGFDDGKHIKVKLEPPLLIC